MADEQVNIVFSESGASIVGEKVRSVTRDVQKMKDLFEQAFTKGNNVGASGSGSLFDPTVVKNFGNEVDKSAGKVLSFTQIMNQLRNAFVIREVIKLGGDLLDLTDTLTNLQNKIAGVTDSQAQMAVATQDVIDIATKSRSNLEDTGTTFVRITRAVDEFGKTQAQTMKFTQTLSEAVRVGGSTMKDAAGAINQLAVGMESGAIKGRELRTMMLQLPEVAKLIADHMGIAVVQLKEFAKEGKLTTDDIFEAVIEGADREDAKFAKLKTTWEQGWEVFKTSAVSALSVAQPLVDRLGESIGKLGTNLQNLPVILDVLSQNWSANSKAMSGTWYGKLLSKIADGISVESIATAVLPGSLTAAGRAIGRIGQSSIGRQVSAEIANRKVDLDAANLDDSGAFRSRANILPEAKAPPGKSFEDLMRMMQETLNVLSVGVLKINVNPLTTGGAFQTPDKGFLLAGVEDSEVAKKSRAIEDQLGKKQPRLTDPQKEALEDLVRQQVGIIEGKKEQLELEKTINKELDERLKREVDIIDAQNKRSKELGEQIQHEQNLAVQKRESDRVSLIQGLNPNEATNKKILDLENARDNVHSTKEEVVELQQAIDRLQESMSPLAVAFQNLGDTMVQGFSDAIAQALVLHKNLGDLMKDLVRMIAMQAISSSIQAGIGGSTGGQDGKGTGIIGALGGLFTSAAVGAAGNAGTANTSSTSTTVGGIPGFSAPGFPDASGGFGVFPGHAAGGYTGDFGTRQPVGVVHGREYVLNAAATSSIGVQALGAMNSGGASALAPKITINNNAAGEGYMARVESTSPGQIQIMIDKSIHEKAPTVVAGAMADKNSIVSKSIRRNFDTNARNV